MRHQPSSYHGGGPMPPGVGHVEYSDTVGTVRFADGVLSLKASADTLTLRIAAEDEDGRRRLQDGIAARLRTICRRDRVTLTWRQVESPADPTEVIAHGTDASPGLARGKVRWRGRFGTLALLGAGALILALHLGVGGAALAALAWTGWVGNMLLVVVLGAVGVIGAHVILGSAAYRGGKVVHARRKQRRTSPGTGQADDGILNEECR